jgi:hypothetical protein
LCSYASEQAGSRVVGTVMWDVISLSMVDCVLDGDLMIYVVQRSWHRVYVCYCVSQGMLLLVA